MHIVYVPLLWLKLILGGGLSRCCRCCDSDEVDQTLLSSGAGIEPATLRLMDEPLRHSSVLDVCVSVLLMLWGHTADLTRANQSAPSSGY